MSSHAQLVRLETIDSSVSDPTAPKSQTEIDASHGTTGWSAYDVWRSRVFVPQLKGYKKPNGNS